MSTALEILTTGLDYHRKRDFPEAERHYREVLRLDPAQVDAHHLLGVVLFETGRTEEALASLEQALRLNPGFAEAHYNLGRALAELGRANGAITSYRKAI